MCKNCDSKVWVGGNGFAQMIRFKGPNNHDKEVESKKEEFEEFLADDKQAHRE